jgi:hypothetical protein
VVTVVASGPPWRGRPACLARGRGSALPDCGKLPRGRAGQITAAGTLQYRGGFPSPLTERPTSGGQPCGCLRACYDRASPHVRKGSYVSIVGNVGCHPWSGSHPVLVAEG